MKAISSMRYNSYQWRFGIVLWISVLVQGAVFAQSNLPINSKAEEWVKKQLSQGLAADLRDPFPNEGDRILGAAFIEKIFSPDSGEIPNRTSAFFIRHATIRGTLDLRETHFSRAIVFKDCLFEGMVILFDCSFARGLTLENNTFFQEVDLHGIHTEKDLSLRNSLFQKSVDLSGTIIQGEYLLSKARFLDPEKGVNLVGTEISKNAYLNQTLFEGPVRGSDLTIGGQIQANDSHFLDKKTGAQFPRLFANGVASFNHSTFEGSADFSSSVILGQFQANGTRFNHPESPVDFSHIQIEESLFLRQSIFQGPVRFMDMQIDGSLDLAEAAILNATAPLDFSRSTIRDAQFQDCQFAGYLILDDMTYRSIEAGDEQGGDFNLLALFQRSRFNEENYDRLEEYFRERGNFYAADHIHIASQERVRRERLTPYSLPWCANWLIGHLAEHGRNPERLLTIMAGIVIFGAVFVFRSSRMKSVDPYDLPFRHPFIYSLELFLPLVNLRIAEHWQPKPKAVWVRRYQCIHILLGWILVPLAVMVIVNRLV